MDQKWSESDALGWRYILVLAVEVVLPAELTRPSFVAFLLSRAAVVARLGGANLLSPYLLGGAIVCHVGGLGIWSHWLAILLDRWRSLGMVWLSVGMGGTDGVVVAIRYAAIGTMLRVHGPRGVVSAMLHGRLSLGLYVDTDAETGGPGTLGLWG